MQVTRRKYVRARRQWNKDRRALIGCHLPPFEHVWFVRGRVGYTTRPGFIKLFGRRRKCRKK